MGKKLVDKPEDWSKIVGTPDSWDKKNIEALVRTFEKTTFDIPEMGGKITGAQWIKSTVAEARQRHQVELNNDYGLKSKQMDMRILTTVPRPLYMKLLEGYPTLFKDYKQHIWFAKNFSQFRIPRKI